ncbi:MAG: GDSL-type esterase/lipase family protein [Clostridiales bacterium]|jgi:lysophospholipase L1-like esterase|nr:GDSL-type esterase/lipase family protein [Clostridiales bacterium]
MTKTGLVPNARVLFSGDSITDGGRSYADLASLGESHPHMFAEAMKALHPGERITVFNTGVAGDTPLNLYYRISGDIELQPDYIVILIGVNDAWNGYKGRAAFERVYRLLLGEFLSKTQAELLVMEPFLIEATPEMQRNCVIENLNGFLPSVREMTAAVRQLAAEYRLKLIPLAEIIRQELEAGTPPDVLAADGIHPAPRLKEIMLDQIMQGLGISGYAPKFGPYKMPEKAEAVTRQAVRDRICVNARQKTLIIEDRVYHVTGDTEFYVSENGATRLAARGRAAMFCKDCNVDFTWFNGRLVAKSALDGIALTAEAVFVEKGAAEDWVPVS